MGKRKKPEPNQKAKEEAELPEEELDENDVEGVTGGNNPNLFAPIPFSNT